MDLRLFLAEKVDSFFIKGLNNKLVAMSQFISGILQNKVVENRKEKRPTDKQTERESESCIFHNFAVQERLN